MSRYPWSSAITNYIRDEEEADVYIKVDLARAMYEVGLTRSMRLIGWLGSRILRIVTLKCNCYVSRRICFYMP